MVDRIVRSMDINPLMDTYDGIGAPPYSPKMLLSLVVFAYINEGRTDSRGCLPRRFGGTRNRSLRRPINRLAPA